MTASGELKLVGGMAVVRTKETPKDKMVAAFFRVWAIDTDESQDAEFEALLAAALRAADGYYRSLGWKPPEKKADRSLSLFVAD